MPERSHYEVLGVPERAAEEEIRRAFRRIAFECHPDRTQDPEKNARFLEATAAYEALTDPDRRSSYDRLLDMNRQIASERGASRRPTPEEVRERMSRTGTPQGREQKQAPSPATTASTEDIVRLSGLMARGRLAEAERVARRLASARVSHPMPYAVLGDISRMRGHYPLAAEFYAQAAQLDPRNPLFLKKHEEVVRRHGATEGRSGPGARVNTGPLALVAVVSMAAATYLALSQESPMSRQAPLISTWTGGLFVMAILCGLALGAALSAGNFLERIGGGNLERGGRLPVGVSLMGLAVLNFWIAAGSLFFILSTQRAIHYAAPRLVAGVAMVTLMLTAGASINDRFDSTQVLLWSGNVVYVAAIVGWLVVDAYFDEGNPAA